MKQKHSKPRSPLRVVSDRLADGSGDSGVALVFVVGTMMVLGSLALTALAYTVSSQKLARYDQDYSAAMSAAQAGIDDFIAHLNRADDYYTEIDCDNVAEQGPTSEANECGWDASTPLGWAWVDSARTGTKDGSYHYSIDAKRATTEGTVTLTVTGKVNGVYRTVESAVGKGGSTDHVYYTDFESADPSNKVSYPGTVSAACGGNGYDDALYWWQGRNTKSCSEITFVSGDVLQGSVFSNDSILSAGATFTSGLSTADPACKAAVLGTESTWTKCLRSGSSGANFNHVKPSYSTALYLDDTSAAFATYPGCRYFGSARIVFNADGTMTVWNKTVNNGGNAPVATSATGSDAPTCGSLTELNSTAGATVPVPDDMVVYTGDAPSGTAKSQCVAGQLGGPTGATLPLGTYTTPLPTATSTSTYTYDVTMANSSKTCQSGNVYIEGVLKGRVTVAAQQSIVVTGDVVLAGGLNGSDMLGLVATNSVEVFQPFLTVVSTTRDCQKKSGSTCTTWGAYYWNTTADSWTAAGSSHTGWAHPAGWPRQYNDPTTTTQVSGVQIMGSIQTLQHSFTVQQYSSGSGRGTLQVNGSIAQRWRGAVGTGTMTTGYLKNYIYDSRLKYSAPPYFPRWVNAQWIQRYFGETRTDPSMKK